MLAWSPTAWELIVILVVGILLFGRRLPEVGREIGRALARKRALEEKDALLLFLIVAVFTLFLGACFWLVHRSRPRAAAP
jgi:TatA/E family protein of Tat protein translocase